MGPIWGRQDPGGPHFGPMSLAIWDTIDPGIREVNQVDMGKITLSL